MRLTRVILNYSRLSLVRSSVTVRMARRRVTETTHDRAVACGGFLLLRRAVILIDELKHTRGSLAPSALYHR